MQQALATAGPQEDELHTKMVNRVERELIAQVLASCDNVQIKAAARLGINRNTLHKKLKEYGLDEADDASATAETNRPKSGSTAP